MLEGLSVSRTKGQGWGVCRGCRVPCGWRTAGAERGSGQSHWADHRAMGRRRRWMASPPHVSPRPLTSFLDWGEGGGVLP